MQMILSSVCLALTSAVVGNAYFQKKQFYPAVVYITKSNASMAVIYIQFFVIVFMFGKLLRKIFLGTLRAAEFEHLLERFWYALTETCLAFTVFRDDFNPRFVALFTVLLFLKSFHWLAEERVDFMERSPVLGVLFHIRVTSLLSVLGVLDYLLLMHAYSSTLVRGPTVQLVFGFEYAILFTVVASTAVKYVLHAWEMRTDTPWENKAVFLLYTELVIGLIKVVLYILFVVIMAKIYALPMFVFRPMFFTIRNFKKALSDVIMSRRAIRNMNTLYPDATPEELRLSDNICIICREDMVNHSKKLPCGHIFHTTCLRSWFQRQQTCPTCRLNILRTRQDAPTAAAGAAAAAAGAPPAAAAAAAAAGVAAPGGDINAAAAATAGSSGQPPIGGGGGAAQPEATGGANIDPTMLNNFLSASRVTGMPNFPLPPGLPGMPPGFAGMPPGLAGMPPMAPSTFMMPSPFGFMPPFSVPPPEIPPELTHFTDDELRALEGNERRNIEERIKLLRNIQTMLDAAGVLMNNYQLAMIHTQAQKANSKVKAAEAGAPTNNVAEGPSTSSAAAAAVAAAAAAAPNVPPAAVEVPTVTKTADEAAAAATKSAVGAATTPSSSSSASQSKHNEVTIEDIGGEEHEYDASAKSEAATAVAAAAAAATGALGENDEELNILRRRRLKFLQECNNKTSTAGPSD